MKRYHKIIYFPSQYDNELKRITDSFNNNKKFNHTNHAFFNLKNRFDYHSILEFLANKITFKIEDIFEYYIEDDKIIKLCYKMPYNEGQDLIIVLSDKKAIVTLYINNKGDNHKTLKNELYCVN